MGDWTAPQLRELMRVEICAERRLRDALRAEDRRWIEQSIASVAKALELEAKELARRLDDLNHSHAEAQRVLATYLPRELYERAHSEVVEWQRKADVLKVEIDARIKSVELGLVNLPGGIKSLELGLAAQSGQRVGSTMTQSTAITLAAVVVAIVAGIIGLLSYLK